MTDENKDAPKVMMLPPMLVLLHVAAGIVLDWAVPLDFGHFWGWPGLALLAVAVVTTGWARRLFERAGTNVPPDQPALVIVKDGPYRFTRNPMYLGFLVGFAGLSLLADAPLMLLLTFSLFYFLDRRIVVPEEEYLTQKFGDVYRDYQRQVRRWI